MRYDVRNSQGRFAKVETIDWNKEKQAMTIDNESGETVTLAHDIPTTLPVTGEESMIRGQMSKVADYIVQLSGWAKKFEEAEAKMNSLNAALDDAMRRVADAEAARDRAVAETAVAVVNERMAKEAYTVVAKERDEAKDKLGMYSIEIEDLKVDKANLNAGIDNLSRQVVETGSLLSLAREERDRFREEAGALRVEIDDAQRDHNEQLASLQAKLDEVNKENSGLHHKINGLEDDHKRALDDLAAHRDRILHMRNIINDVH